MPVDPGPFELDETAVVLGPRGDAIPKPVSPSFYEELDAEFGGFAGHVLISEHGFGAAWATWERHPTGDEFVYLLEGDADFVPWSEAGERTLRVSTPGAYVVVPRGTWHTVRPRRPTRMLFVTPGEATEHAADPR